MKRHFVAAVAAFATLLAAGAAQAQSGLYMGWTMSEMRGVVTGLGYTVTDEEYQDDGDPKMFVKSKTGLNFSIAGTECAGVGAARRCRGADMISYIDYDTAARAETALETYNYKALKSWKDDADSVGFGRYVIFDGGISRLNLETNITVFVGLVEEILDKG